MRIKYSNVSFEIFVCLFVFKRNKKKKKKKLSIKKILSINKSLRLKLKWMGFFLLFFSVFFPMDLIINN
jgi:hypothetical protein